MAHLNLNRRTIVTRSESRRIERTRSPQFHEEPYSQKKRTHLSFIKFDAQYVPMKTPHSPSLTRRYFDPPFNLDKCSNGRTLDQFFIRTGPVTHVMWNDHWSPCKDAVPFYGSTLFSRWSPLGSYFVTSNDNIVILSGSTDYNGFGRCMRFNHHKVEQFDISPGEKYLVTYRKPDPSVSNGLWLKVFDVRTGRGLFGVNGGVTDSPQWPVIRWAGGKDDKYFAILSKNNTISVYNTETFSLLGEKPLNLDDDDVVVVDISWSPTESLLALLLKRGGKQPAAKCLLLRIPDKVKLAEAELPCLVDDCKMHWQSNGEYLAVSTYSGFVFFRIKEKGIPIDSLKVDKNVLSFAWEPSGHRFAVIHRGDEEPNLSVSFYTMERRGTVSELFTLRNKQADALFWSPRGKLIVLAGLKERFNGKLEFFDVDRPKKIIRVQQHLQANHVVWDPSGRYVATAVTIPQEEFDRDCYSEPEEPLNRFNMWSSNGNLLYVHQCYDRLIQLDWRPYGGSIDDDMLKMQKNPFEDCR